MFPFITDGIRKCLLFLKAIPSKNFVGIFCGKTFIRDLMNFD